MSSPVRPREWYRIRQMVAGETVSLPSDPNNHSPIHVDDIAMTVRAAMAKPSPGRIYNVADNLPAPSADLVTYACALMKIEPPPEIPFEEAVLSPMAREFWADNKRIDNSRIKTELGVKLAYPTYREGLKAILAAK